MAKAKFASMLEASAFLHPTERTAWDKLRKEVVDKAVSIGCSYETLAEVPIDWSTDQDSNSHVASATYPQYGAVGSMRQIESFEASIGPERVAAMHKGKNDVQTILKDLNVVYKRAAAYPDSVLIGTRLLEVKPDRYRPLFTLFSVCHGHIVAEVSCWVVFVNTRTGRPVKLLEAQTPYPALHEQLCQQLESSQARFAEWQKTEETSLSKSRL